MMIHQTLMALKLFGMIISKNCSLLQIDVNNAISTLLRFSINLLVVYRESVNLIGYLTRRLSAVSITQIVD